MTEPVSAFDPVKHKSTTRAQWDTAAEAWHRWGGLLGSWLGPATETMFDMAGIGPGSRVLDVAAGAGEQTMAAARRVGTNGYVLATDLSAGILDHAAALAREQGHSQVATQVLDGEALDTLPVSIIRRRAQLGPPLAGQPGPFSLGGEGVLAAAIEQAGFKDVQSVTIDAPLRVPTAAECLAFEKESFGALHQMLGGLPDSEKDDAWAEIEEALQRFEGRPTNHERMVWGRGDGSDLRTFPSRLGILGALICYEHANALFRYAVQAQHEVIHIGMWPGGMGGLLDIIDASTRHYGFEGQSFGVTATSILTEDILEALGNGGSVSKFRTGGGRSMIVDPRGKVLAEAPPDEETILYAELDFDDIARAKMVVDSCGHYSRPDVVYLQLDSRKKRPLQVTRDPD